MGKAYLETQKKKKIHIIRFIYKTLTLTVKFLPKKKKKNTYCKGCRLPFYKLDGKLGRGNIYNCLQLTIF